VKGGLVAAAVVMLVGACGDHGSSADTSTAPSGSGSSSPPTSSSSSNEASTSVEVRRAGDHRELDLRFVSDGTELAGTLFLPPAPGRFPAMVWVHASGEHERLGYGELVKAAIDAGLGFFSYDKRGVGESQGKCCPADAEDAGVDEFSEQADDALAGLHAVGQVPEIDAGHLGFLGVSQAGWIVPIAASQSPDVAFTVLASGPTVTTGEESFYSELTGDSEVTDESQRAALSQQLANHGPSGFDPKPFLAQQGVPGLWLFGSNDGSIPVPESVKVLDELSAQGREFSHIVFPGAGHGLLDTDPPPPPEVAPTIIDWIRNTVG
jgi:dienelactone hydrolase